MKELTTWKELRTEFGTKNLIDGFTGAFALVLLPLLLTIAAIIEFITVFLYLLTLSVFLIIIALFVSVFVLFHLWRRSLMLMNEEVTLDFKKLFLKPLLIFGIVVLILGLIFIFFLIPILFV